MSLSEAVEYQPVKPTYAIRIFSSFDDSDYKPELQESHFYQRIAKYIFDDNDSSCKAGPVTITEDIANAIVIDFAESRNGVEALLVHCTRGRNRSPAVAIALNEIFSLGHDSKELKARFNESNWAVYKAILKTGQRHKF